jgi:hypothetical protein
MKLLNLLLIALLATSLSVRAEDKKPAPAPAAATKEKDSVSTLELRANEALNRGQFSLAKDLFTKVTDRLKSESKPDQKRLDAIAEQIRACEANIKKQAAAIPSLTPGADQPTEPVVETASEKRKKHNPKEGEVYAIPLKELGNFDYDADKGGNIPDDVKKLTGKKIRVQGFMIPLDQADNISHFSLVPSLFACCFGQPPQIQHQVVVHTPKGKAVGYYPDEIVCEGTLKVEEKKDEGYIVSIFEMDVTSVKPAAK